MATREELELSEFRLQLKTLVRTGKADLEQVEKLYDQLIASSSQLEYGKWLVELRQILERSGNFGRFLQDLPLFALRTAYRYLNGYETCRRAFAPAIVEQAMEMDLPLYGNATAPFGRFTKEQSSAEKPIAKDGPQVAR
jgi:hypothetical protein